MLAPGVQVIEESHDLRGLNLLAHVGEALQWMEQQPQQQCQQTVLQTGCHATLAEMLPTTQQRRSSKEDIRHIV